MEIFTSCSTFFYNAGNNFLHSLAKSKILFLSPFFLLLEKPATAQWQLVGPNKTTIAHEASVINSIVITNNSYGGLFVSGNGGVTWKNEGAQINNEFAAGLLSDGQHLFCLTGYNLYESDDAGNSWYSVSYNLKAPITNIYLYKGRLFAITGNTIYYRDAFQNQWQLSLSNNPPKEQGVYVFHQYDTLFAVAYFFNSYINSEYISLDTGQTWVAQPGGRIYSVLPNKPGFWTDGYSLFFSSANQDREIATLDSDVISNSYAGIHDYYQVYNPGNRNQYIVQYDTAGNKKYINTSLAETGAVISIFRAGDTLYEYKNFNLYKSGDEGQNWIYVNAQGLYGLNTRFFSPVGSTFYAGTSYGVFTSADSGRSWEILQDDSLPDFTRDYYPVTDYASENITEYPVNLFEAEDTFYLAASHSGIFKSIDGGVHWSSAGLNHGIDYTLNFLLKGRSSFYVNFKLAKSPLFAGIQDNGFTGLYVKGKGDTSWTLVNHDLYNRNYTFGREVAFSRHPEYDGVYYFIGNQVLSGQNGRSSIPYHANSFFIDSVTNFYLCAQEGLFKYEWSPTDEIAPVYNISDVSNNLPAFAKWINDGLILGSKIYLATNIGIYEADTSDFNWTDISYNLEGIAVNKILYRGGFLYASTNSGLFEIDQAITGIENPPAHASFLIYPNPSISSFFVNVHFSPSEKLSLTVVNLNGQTLLNTQIKDGLNEIQFYPIPSNGIYLCRLFSDHQLVAQQKLVIIR